MKEQTLILYIILTTLITIVGCSGKERNIDCLSGNYAPKDFDRFNHPRVFVKFDKPINGYNVKVMCFPKQEFMGQAILYFENDSNRFYIYNQYFGTRYLDSLSRSYIGNNMYYRDRTTITLKYTQNNEYLDGEAPFFFRDVDFDGVEELLITNWGMGTKGSHEYDIYKIASQNAIPLVNAPFYNPTGKMRDYNTEFDTIHKTIIIHKRSGSIYYGGYLKYKAVHQGTQTSFSIIEISNN